MCKYVSSQQINLLSIVSFSRVKLFWLARWHSRK